MSESSNDVRSGYRAHPAIKAWAAIGVGAAVFHAVRFGIGVFGPARPYRLQPQSDATTESEDFLYRLSCLTDAITHRHARITILRNGAEFYPAEFSAIDAATHTINIEAYEFLKGDLTREIIARLAHKARQGVRVRIIIDALGSLNTGRSYFKPLTDAGGHIAFYHPLSWRDWPYVNHRTHRKLLITDGTTGFIGGAGFADHWVQRTNDKLPWRDTVLKVEGAVAASLNATFAQGWVDSTGELLFSKTQFPPEAKPGGTACMVVMSTPGYDATRAQMLFQTLIDSARHTIQITSPYFLPDRSARHALKRAMRNRGVRVQILTAGPQTDHNSIRYLSHATSTSLIRSGVEFYEYQPAMIHAKLMVIDNLWSVAGSTNFDPRSLRLNNEVNIAIRDADIASQLSCQFVDDLKQSCRITADGLRHENPAARLIGDAGWLIENEE
ncbi:MAG TPA: phospholipase D-like domain-containing protein [Bryobacteraceae bacterium]|nr:phospholipase D-like domain-containing protein [Bryobacteraceae bacterium]